jgi:hypothetical protein
MLTIWTIAVGWPFLMKGLVNAGNGVGVKGKERVARGSKKMSRKSRIDGEVWGMRVEV